MTARKFEENDYLEMAKWYEVRKKPVPPKEYFPKTGFIVEGVAAGFIYKTDSGVAFLDGYITNPEEEADDRWKALDVITELLINHAKTSGYKAVKADTIYDKIKILAMRHKFKYTGEYSSFFKEI